MNTPEEIWEAPLGQMTLGKRVNHKIPSPWPIEDNEAFINIWKNRLTDAKRAGYPDVEFRAQAVIDFAVQHQAEKLSLLLWSENKISAIVAEVSKDFYVIE